MTYNLEGPAAVAGGEGAERAAVRGRRNGKGREGPVGRIRKDEVVYDAWDPCR